MFYTLQVKIHVLTMAKYSAALTLVCLFSGAALNAQTPQRITDLRGAANEVPANLTSFNGKLYFSAADDSVGRELWVYDGTGNPPTLVADLRPGIQPGLYPLYSSKANTPFPILNGKMYFLGHTPAVPAAMTRQLISYDGTGIPTPAAVIGDSVVIQNTDMVTFGNRIFFAAGTSTTGTELYAYDGISAPTVYDINPSAGSSPRAFTAFNGKLYFVATGDNATGEELYTYNPATNVCALVADINPGAAGSSCMAFTPVGNKMFFTATTQDYGTELYEYDGATVTRLTDLVPGDASGIKYGLAYYKGSLIFGGTTEGVYLLPYKYDLSTGQCTRISNDTCEYVYGMTSFTEYKGVLYFSGSRYGQWLPTYEGDELWRYDGVQVTQLPIWSGRYSSSPRNYYVHNNSLYFTARNTNSDFELYRLNDPTSVVNTRFAGDLKVFPNPAKTHARFQLTLKNPQQLSIAIADMTGKVVSTTGLRAFGSGINEITIPLQSFACGSYSYQVMNSTGQSMAAGILVKE
jgi:ELWxxDGT repeat protein